MKKYAKWVDGSIQQLKKWHSALFQLLEKWPWTKKVGVKRVGWGLTGITVILLIVIVLSFFRPKSTEVGLSWATVLRGDFVVSLVESGDVEAVSQYSINAPMMWGASNLQVIDLVPEGTNVKKGDFLLQFDVSDLEDQKTIREDRLESLLADLQKLKAQQSLTMSNLESQLSLSEYSFDQAKLRLEMRKYESEARQEEARLELKQAEIDLRRIQTQIESQRIIHKSQIIQRETAIREARNNLESVIERINRLQLTAPTDGMVVYQQVRGERVKEGYQARPGWPLMSIPDLSRMQVKVFLNEVDRTKVISGQEVSLVMEAYPEETFTGRVREIARLAQTVTGEERLNGFVCFIDINGTDPRLKPGMTARVNIISERVEDAVFIPVGALFEIDGKPVVFRYGSQKPVEVDVGSRNDGFITVSGINRGARLAWNPAVPADPFGWQEEKRRIDEVNRKLQQSFDLFAERGILYDYGIEPARIDTEEADERPGINIDNLPASIRNRLQSTTERRGDDEEPDIVVESPDQKMERGTFRVSPQMMERLNRTTKSGTDTTSARN